MIRTACGLAPLAPLTWACAADLTWAGRPKSSVALVRSLLPDAVHGAEGGRGQGGERAGVVGHRRWDALPAGQPGGDQPPGVPLVGGAARFTGGGAAVATRDPGGAVELLVRGVQRADLAGAGVDQPAGAAQSHRSGAAVGALLRRGDASLAQQAPQWHRSWRRTVHRFRVDPVAACVHVGLPETPSTPAGNPGRYPTGVRSG